MGADELDSNSHKGDLWHEVERLRAALGAIRDVIDRYDWDDPRLDSARGTIGGVELHLHLLDDAGAALRSVRAGGEGRGMDETYDMRTIEGCIGWGLFRNPPERQRLEAELRQLRAIESAATTLRARVREWATLPYRGEGHEEEYALATNAAEDAILVAASAYDAALRCEGRLGEGND